MDSYLSIAGLALSIAALVPVLFPSTRIKLWTITAAALSLVILIAVFQVYKEVAENRAVQASKEEIWGLLTKNEKGMTFEQIYDNMYYPSFSVANTAIDELISEGRVLNDKVDVTGQNDAKFVGSSGDSNETESFIPADRLRRPLISNVSERLLFQET